MTPGFAVFFAFFSLGLPVIVIFTISRLGWNRLAARYPRATPAPAPLTVFGYGCLNGWVGYNGGLIIAADDSGLFLSTWPGLLAWCHAPVFIPWSQIVDARARRRWWKTYFTLDLKGAPEIDLALSETDLRLVRPWLDKAGVPVVPL